MSMTRSPRRAPSRGGSPKTPYMRSDHTEARAHGRPHVRQPGRGRRARAGRARAPGGRSPVGHHRAAAAAGGARRARAAGHVLRRGPEHRALSRRGQGDRRARPRDRHARLAARALARARPGRGDRHPRPLPGGLLALRDRSARLPPARRQARRRGFTALREAGIDWCSPEGEAVDVRDGMAVLPFRWELVDATYLHRPFGALRRKLGLPEAPLDPQDFERRLWAQLEALPEDEPAVVILHPFLTVDDAAWAAERRDPRAPRRAARRGRRRAGRRAAMSDLVVVGSVNADLVVRVRALPAPGETVERRARSSATTAARAPTRRSPPRGSARAWHSSAQSATDDLGADAVAALEGEGIDCSGVTWLEDAPTGVALIVVDEAGENQIAVASGANAGWRARPSPLAGARSSCWGSRCRTRRCSRQRGRGRRPDRPQPRPCTAPPGRAAGPRPDPHPQRGGGPHPHRRARRARLRRGRWSSAPAPPSSSPSVRAARWWRGGDRAPAGACGRHHRRGRRVQRRARRRAGERRRHPRRGALRHRRGRALHAGRRRAGGDARPRGGRAGPQPAAFRAIRSGLMRTTSHASPQRSSARITIADGSNCQRRMPWKAAVGNA